MAKLRFFDTSALQHRYVDSPASARVRRLTSSTQYERVVAESTILEMVSTFARRCRSGGHGAEQFDRWERKFFDDIANGLLSVRRASQQDVLRARHLLRFAGMIRRRSLSSGDALIASVCLTLALERRSVVTFYSSDWPLYSILREVGAFTSTLRLVFIGDPKNDTPAISGRKTTRHGDFRADPSG